MSVDGFIPQIWTARLLAALQKALVFGQANVVNRDYEGEISQKGDTVNIGGIGAITVKEYTKNTDIDAPEDLDDEMTALVIDQADYFNFQVDDIDARQAATRLVDAAMTDAAYRMRDKADRYLALQIIADGTAANTTATDAYVQLVELGVQLDEADVPTAGRYAVVPPAFHGLLLQDDRFVASGALPADQRLLNGQIGEAAGFAILKSNNARDDATPAYRTSSPAIRWRSATPSRSTRWRRFGLSRASPTRSRGSISTAPRWSARQQSSTCRSKAVLEMATVVSTDEVSSVMATGLEPDALEDVIAREEAWLANDSQFGIGQLAAARTQTLWVGRDHRGPLLLARPTDGPTAVVDAGVEVTDDVVLTGTARLERASGAPWAGPRVDVTYEPNDLWSVKRVVIELVRLSISASPYQAESTDGHSRSYDVGGAAKLRAQLARSLRPHAGPLTARLGSTVLPPVVRT